MSLPVLRTSAPAKAPLSAGESAHEVIRRLQQRVEQIEGARRSGDEVPVGTGCAGLDRLFLAGGMQRGTLVECFLADGVQQGGGAGTLAMLLAQRLAADGGALVVMDSGRVFYPPAAAALGVDWGRLIVVRAKSAQDELWALDQALRSPGVAAVWAPLKRLGARDFRRLQLAAESSGAVGLLLRPAHSHKQPSWAHVQLAVSPLREADLPSCSSPTVSFKGRQVGRSAPLRGWHLQVKALRARGARLNAAVKSVVVEIDETTGQLSQASSSHAAHRLHPFSAVADSTPDRGTA